ncbi:MAG: DUF4056 domain-containing protein, partial [Bdellovibrionales bacterium]|nr:DUF4056 domain-containing protein [Bdellovibrionales bacterium]
RDNADWSAHIYIKLREWLGSGKEILARREGGFKKRAVFFPELNSDELAELSDDDLEQLAISIGFSMALLHEIPSSFKFPVSVPNALFTNEMSSAFSLEDAYSNLLGNMLGARAARSAIPFNQAMTDLLLEELTELEAQPRANTFEAYEMVRNQWWIQGFNSTFKNILKRDFTFEGEISPRLIENTSFCSRQTVPKKITIPKVLSNGRPIDDYYEIRGTMNKKLKKGLKKLDISINNPLTQFHYPQVIKAIKADFIRQLGRDI